MKVAAMPLHLFSIEPSPTDLVELQEIRLLPGEPPLRQPRLREWTSRPEDQTLVHAATGCRFAALRLEQGVVEGLRVPFPDYEIGMRFLDMDGGREMLPLEEIKDLGRQGITWILTYTYEARRRAR